jgi:AcrR family transcriptional regulator
MAQSAEPIPEKSQRRPAFRASRQKLLDAAQSLFSEKGFRATTTRELAQRAGVADMTVFRHFPTKEALFEEAVVAPVRGQLASYVRTHLSTPIEGRDLYSEARRFHDGLLELMLGENRALVALAGALAFEQGQTASPELTTVIDSFLGEIVGLFRQRAPEHGYAIDPDIAPRLLFGMALSAVVHGHWLFPSGHRPSREVLLDELTKLTVYGVSGKPHD